MLYPLIISFVSYQDNKYIYTVIDSVSLELETKVAKDYAKFYNHREGGLVNIVGPSP